jgi:hypothetical protein
MLLLKREANGFRGETKGNVRVNDRYLGLGISFREMSEENMARWRELLGDNLSANCGHGVRNGQARRTRQSTRCGASDSLIPPRRKGR